MLDVGVGVREEEFIFSRRCFPCLRRRAADAVRFESLSGFFLFEDIGVLGWSLLLNSLLTLLLVVVVDVVLVVLVPFFIAFLLEVLVVLVVLVVQLLLFLLRSGSLSGENFLAFLLCSMVYLILSNAASVSNST